MTKSIILRGWEVRQILNRKVDILLRRPTNPRARPDPDGCPFGPPGQERFVKESWCYQGGDEYLYQEDRASVRYAATDERGGWDARRRGWRSSAQMPEWATRLQLEIGAVQAVRIRDLSGSDLSRAGLIDRDYEHPGLGRCPVSAVDGRVYVDLISLLAGWWRSTRKGRELVSFTSNPYVWRIEIAKIWEG